MKKVSLLLLTVALSTAVFAQGDTKTGQKDAARAKREKKAQLKAGGETKEARAKANPGMVEKKTKSM